MEPFPPPPRPDREASVGDEWLGWEKRPGALGWGKSGERRRRSGRDVSFFLRR